MFGGFVKRIIQAFLRHLSREYRYQEHFPRLLVENAYLEAGQFIEKEWSRYSKELLGDLRPKNPSRQSIFLAKLWRDYAQLFGSFSEALGAREAFQRQVLAYRNPFWRWKFAVERKQILIERPLVVAESVDAAVLATTGKSLAHKRIRRLIENEARKFQDFDFERIVRDKKVLILGPSAKASITQEFLDGFDVLAVPKLHQGSWLPGSIRLRPTHCIVTYLNHLTVSRIAASSRLESELWSVARVKSEEDRALLRSILDEGCKNQIGIMRMPGHLMMSDYGAFMGPGMVFDILCGYPSSVCVVGFSFYLDADRASYFRKYDSSNHDEYVLLTALRNHGAVANFGFMKSLSEAGLISLRGETLEALTLTVEKYVQELDLRFGQYFNR